ncbi:hypothetical protein HDU86_001827 [Geranomyces michiganensis]|nr:hypothetical protein HDU86_001827 [Geranomyces michiganensis]
MPHASFVAPVAATAPAAGTKDTMTKNKKSAAKPKQQPEGNPPELKSTVDKAVDALIAHHNKRAAQHPPAKTDLLALQQQDASGNTVLNVDLMITTKQFPKQNKSHLRAQPIRLVEPLYTGADVLLITKDPQREYKDLLAEKGITGITKVMDYSHLRANFSTHEARRQLAASYDLFLGDERVLALLPKALGKTFFAKKLLPVPINLTAKDLERTVRWTLKSTFLRKSEGVTTSVRVATTAMENQKIKENILGAIPQIVRHTEGGWNNIRNILVKTSRSAALPLYTSLPNAPVIANNDAAGLDAPVDEDAETDRNAGEVEPDSDDEAAADGHHGGSDVVTDTLAEVLDTLSATKKLTKSALAAAAAAASTKASPSSEQGNPIKKEKYSLNRKLCEKRMAIKKRREAAAAADQNAAAEVKSAPAPAPAAIKMEKKMFAATKKRGQQETTEAKEAGVVEEQITPARKKRVVGNNKQEKPADEEAKKPATPVKKEKARATPAAAAAATATATNDSMKTPTKTPSKTPAPASAKKSAKKAVLEAPPAAEEKTQPPAAATANAAAASPTSAAAAETTPTTTPTKKKAAAAAKSTTPAKTPAAASTPMKTRSASAKKSALKK